MRFLTALACASVLTFPGLSELAAQTEPIAFRGAEVHPISSPMIARGTVLIDNGKIVAVGPVDQIRIPRDTKVVDLEGKVILPGLVDTHSHIGSVSGGDNSAALHPEVRTLDGIDIRSDSFNRARVGGLTTVNLMSGSGHLMSGQTTYLKLRRGATKIEDWLFCEDPLTDVCGGLKMANGTNSMRQPPFPGTRGKSAALVRALFLDAQGYRDKLEAAASDPDKDPPERDLGMETLVEVLEGKRPDRDLRLEALGAVLEGDVPALITAQAATEIMTALRLQQEFGFDLILDGAAEASLVIADIRAAGAPVLLHPPMMRASGEAISASRETGAALRDAGILFAFQGGYESYVPKTRVVLWEAAIAAANGLGFDDALTAISIDAARVLGIGDRVGSLEVGKDADLVLYDGDPFEYTSHVCVVLIEGEVVSDECV